MALRPNPIEQELFFGAETLSGWRRRVHVVIFGSNTPGGRAFDIALILAIATSVLVVMLESVASIRERYGHGLFIIEWFFTILFSIEFVLRLACVRQPLRYATSFFGVVDLLAIAPTYLSLVVPGAHYLLAIRLLRILRVFRVLRLVHYLSEARTLTTALKLSRRKIEVFLFAVLTLVVVLGSLMYLIEGSENGFTSIPRSIYWAIVTLTTVGYGDISPQTNLGQALASVVMILGYAILAVPTGIVSAEMVRAQVGFWVPGAGLPEREAAASEASPPRSDVPGQSSACPGCGAPGHDLDALYCKRCGAGLHVS